MNLIVFVFAVGGLLMLLLIPIVVMLLRPRSDQQGAAEDVETLRDLARDMADMERRMDNLDTLLRRDDR